MSKEGKLSKDSMLEKLDIIAKLLYMQVRPRIEELKTKYVKTNKQKQIYDVLDGKKTIDEIARVTNASIRLVKGTLPKWEKQGMILGFGKGAGKRYISIENLEV
jgi:predicted Rossmann fold nucleotide-binding protein DprA/Smf involved in DNA uptake